jgi:hypothetical protein
MDVMPAAPITSAGLRHDLTIDGCAYTLAAPSFGQFGAVLAAAMHPPAPSRELLREAARLWLIEANQPEHAAAIEQLAALDDENIQVYAACPPAADAEGVQRWLEETRDQRRLIARGYLAGQIAEQMAAEAPVVAMLRQRAAAATLHGARSTVAACLRAAPAWQGEAAPDAVLDAIPIPHLLRLAEIGQGFLRPGAEARKN